MLLERTQIESAIIEKLVPIGISRIGVFGSFAREDEDGYKDIDILYDYEILPDVMKFIHAVQDLEEMIGPVDVVYLRAERNPRLQRIILDEAKMIWPKEEN